MLSVAWALSSVGCPAALAAIETSPAVINRRKQLVDAVRGKYRHVPTSSESFLSRKREETDRESRR